MSILVTDPTDLEKMRAACQTAASILDYLTPFVKAGVTTGELDRLCMERINELGVKSATVGYAPPGYPPFPGSICTSVNHVICHGIPGDKVLKNGDILNMDVTIIQDGWFGDTSRMYYVGEPSILARRLTETTYECMWLGIDRSSRAPRWAILVTPFNSTPKSRAFPSYANTADTAWARNSTRTRKCCITASPAPV